MKKINLKQHTNALLNARSAKTKKHLLASTAIKPVGFGSHYKVIFMQTLDLM